MSEMSEIDKRNLFLQTTMAVIHLRKNQKEAQEWFRSQTESRWELPTFNSSGYGLHNLLFT